MASVWGPRKGLQDFVELSSIIDSNTVIVLVGLTPKQMADLPSNIVGIERTDSVEELRDLYSVAVVFVNLTYEDTFPTTNLESLSCGTPIITYQTGGSVEAVTDETGFVVKQGDINAVCKAINIIKDTGKSQFSSFCRGRALELYNKNDRFAEYIRLYNELLNVR